METDIRRGDGGSVYAKSFVDQLEFSARAQKIRISPPAEAPRTAAATYMTNPKRNAVSSTDIVTSNRPPESEPPREQPTVQQVTPSPTLTMGGAPRASRSPPDIRRGTSSDTHAEVLSANQHGTSSDSQQTIPLENQRSTPLDTQRSTPQEIQRSPQHRASSEVRPNTALESQQDTPLEAQPSPSLETQHGKSSEIQQRTPIESQRGQPSTPIQIDDNEERIVPTEAVLPAFATTAKFMVTYAGRHTLHLEAQHRNFRFSNKSPHGDICIVCGQKQDKYIDRFACCSLKFCPDCITYEDGKSLLEVDRFCPLCFKRGWNHIRPYFGTESPVWKLLPLDYKNKYMKFSHEVVETMVRLLPEWCEWQEMLDYGTVESDRLILHTLQPYSISEHGKRQLSAFVSNLSFETLKDGVQKQEGSTERALNDQEPDLQWFVTRPILPLERFERTMEHHQTYINANQSSAAVESWRVYTAAKMQAMISTGETLHQDSSLIQDRAADPEPGDVPKSICPWCAPGKGDISHTLRWKRNVELAMHKLTQLREGSRTQDTEIAALKKERDEQKKAIFTLEKEKDDYKEELAALKKSCTQDHIPDLAAFGMELCRARGIARGNVKGVETRLQGDYLSKLPVQRLLNNPIFDRGWVQPSKKRKHAQDGSGWIVEDTVVKLEDDEEG